MNPINANPVQRQAAIARGQTRQAMHPVLSSCVFGYFIDSPGIIGIGGGYPYPGGGGA